MIVYSSTTNNTTTGEGVREREPVTFNVDTTVDMMGKMVTLYIEKTTILSNSKVLGVSLKDDINHIEATAATKDTLTGYLKGTGIATDKDTQYYVNYGFCKDGATEASNQVIEYARDVEGWTKVGSTNLNTDIFNLNGVSVEVIDNNNDGVVEYVLYRIETLSQVNRYNDKAETVTIYELDRDKNKKLDGTASTITVDFDELVAEDELAADDVVLYIQYGGRTYIKLADYVTDTMTRVDRDTNKELYVTIGGEQYRQAYNPDAASLVDPDIEHFDINTAREDVGFDTRYDFFLDSTGEYIIAYRPTEKAEANYALVLESAWTLNALKRDGQVKILKTDGTTGTYYIDWDESAKAFAGVTSINRNTCYDRNGDGNITAPSPAPNAAPAPNSDALIKDATNSTKLEIYLGTRDVNISGSGTGSGGYNKVNTARGSVIQYSIDENDELTIEAVLQGNTWDSKKDMTIDNTGKEKSTAGVGDNGVIVYLDNNSTNQTSAANPAQKKDPSFQYKLTSTYENGSGTLYVTGADSTELNLDKSGTSANNKVKGKTTNYAIDLGTVGFYYDADEDEYGVAVGWDDMSNVNINTEAQVYPVLTKKNNGTYEASKLAGVVLFEAPTSAITADYFLVLGANAATSGNWHLTVVFEDGTVDEVTVKKGNLGDFEPKVDEHFYQAWSYSEQADGTYKLGTMYKGHNMSDSKDLLESGGKGIAYNLSNQTFALERECTHGANANLLPYVAYGKDFNIWDVTEVEFKGDTTATGKFSNTRVHAVVIEDKNTLRTAWIWDMEDEPDEEEPDYGPTELTAILEGYTFRFEGTGDKGLEAQEKALRAAFEAKGMSIVEFVPTADGKSIAKVIVKDQNNSERTYIPFAVDYSNPVKVTIPNNGGMTEVTLPAQTVEDMTYSTDPSLTATFPYLSGINVGDKAVGAIAPAVVTLKGHDDIKYRVIVEENYALKVYCPAKNLQGSSSSTAVDQKEDGHIGYLPSVKNYVKIIGGLTSTAGKEYRRSFMVCGDSNTVVLRVYEFTEAQWEAAGLQVVDINGVGSNILRVKPEDGSSTVGKEAINADYGAKEMQEVISLLENLSKSEVFSYTVNVDTSALTINPGEAHEPTPTPTPTHTPAPTPSGR